MIRRRLTIALIALLLAAGVVALWRYAPMLQSEEDEDEEDRPIEVPQRISVVDGEHVITLDQASQTLSGIVTARPQTMVDTRTVAVRGTVRDTAALADLYRRYQRALRVTPGLASGIARSAVQRYGAALGDLASPSPALAALASGEAILVELALPSGNAPAVLHARDDTGQALRLDRIGAAPASGHWFYRAPAGMLAPGAAVTVVLPVAAARAGVLIPASAVVWQDGTPWVYVRRGGQQFARVRLADARPRAAGYWSDALALQAEIVVRGAELLLSEESRGRIRIQD